MLYSRVDADFKKKLAGWSGLDHRGGLRSRKSTASSRFVSLLAQGMGRKPPRAPAPASGRGGVPATVQIGAAAQQPANGGRSAQGAVPSVAMGITTGTVVAGQVLVEGLALPEGVTVAVISQEPSHGVRLSPDDEAALLEAMAQAERGETVSAEELFEQLDRRAQP
jgi:hypothetical protein